MSEDQSIQVLDSLPPVYRTSLVRDREGNYGQASNGRTVSEAFSKLWPGLDREQFVVFFLDQRNRIIGANIVSLGDLAGTYCQPREVFKAAILANAARIVLSHNHPSGDPRPSPSDKAVTERLVKAGKLMGIEVLDHVIVGDTHFSFFDEGLL